MKTKTVHYVGQICEEDKELTIKYLKREKPSSYHFIFRSDELFQFSEDDIVCKLPNCAQHGGTARVRRHLKFDVDFSVFPNMC